MRTKFEAQAITSAHPLFKGLLWASVARSSDEKRHTLQHVHVEREDLKTIIVATDGKRIHVHTYDPGLFDGDIQPIEEGNYEIVIRSSKIIVIAPAVDEDLNFPEWRKLFPEIIGFREEMVSRGSVTKIGIRSGVLLNTDLAIEACGFGCGFGKEEAVKIRYASQGENKGVFISHSLGKAIVMPLHLSEEGPIGTERNEEEEEEEAETKKISLTIDEDGIESSDDYLIGKGEQ